MAALQRMIGQALVDNPDMHVTVDKKVTVSPPLAHPGLSSMIDTLNLHN